MKASKRGMVHWEICRVWRLQHAYVTGMTKNIKEISEHKNFSDRIYKNQKMGIIITKKDKVEWLNKKVLPWQQWRETNNPWMHGKTRNIKIWN